MERKEPTLAKITPDRDEVAARQRRQAERSSMVKPPSSVPASGSTGGLTLFALVLAVIGLGASGFLAWKFNEAEQALNQSAERIADLEQRLDITYDESSESVEAIQAKLQWADSEIRKLWGVSYDTNRSNITNNSEQLKTLSQNVSTLGTDLGNLQTDSNATRMAIADLENSLSGVRDAITELDSSMGAIGEQRARLQNLEEKLDQFSDRVAQLDGLGNRVQSNEEAIEAIDAYRRNINQDLMALRKQVSKSSQATQQAQQP